MRYVVTIASNYNRNLLLTFCLPIFSVSVIGPYMGKFKYFLEQKFGQNKTCTPPNGRLGNL